MVLHDAFNFAGINSLDYGVYALYGTVNNVVEKEFENVEIPGRSGDLHIFMKRYKNITITYSCAIIDNADSAFDRFMTALLLADGNQKLFDTIHPTYYRRATFKGLVEPRISRDRNLAVFKLEFDCAPQKWIVEGDTPISISGATTLYNGTACVAKPLIEVVGNGTLSMSSEILTISGNTGTMVIDCEEEDAYDKSTLANLNSKITLSSGEFPVLNPGENGVSKSGLTSVTVYPRWWML